MNKQQLINAVATAIQKADSSYFNEDYAKQAAAVLEAIDKAGFVLASKAAPADTWQKAAEAMKTGRVKPEEHVKNVYEIVVAMLAVR